MKKQRFKRVIEQNLNKTQKEEGFDGFWEQVGLICHLTSSEYFMTFDQIYNAVQSYYIQFPREPAKHDTYAKVALGVVRLIEWGLIIVEEQENEG